MLRWLIACTLLSACSFGSTIDSARCPDGGTALTWEGFGRPFLDRWCQDCHATAAPDRRGAPAGYAFDTVDAVRRWRERIFARAAADNDSMPPGPEDPPAEVRQKLAEWLACGAP